MVDLTELKWVNRYSDTNQPDKHGRLARQLFYKGKHVCWIFRIQLPTTDCFQVVDYYPANGNDSPCRNECEDHCLTVLMHRAELRFLKFLNDII
jgi:hypothetical protein